MAISGENTVTPAISEITVTPEELEVQANQVRAAAKELQDCFSRMRDLVTGTENCWKGNAADAHRSGYLKNQASIDEIIARYQEHVIDLEKMAGIYREAENTAVQLVDTLQPSGL